jgi:hypothetical protein
MAYNIGLNVVEVDGTGAPAIVGAATSVAAFNILTRRGVPNKSVAVTSFPQFVAQYGSYFPGGLGAYLVKGFFDNGGQTAVINRVVSTDSTNGALTSRVSLSDSANPTLKLQAGSRGAVEPGAWGNALYVKVSTATEPKVTLRETTPARVTGTALTPPVDMSGFPSLSVRIDNQTTATVLTFQASDFSGGANAATLAQIRDAINRQTTNLVASLNGNQLVLTSTGAIAKLNRTFTKLEITAANSTLGLTSTTAVNGTPASPTTTSAQLADVSPFNVGDAIKLTDGTKTALAKVLTINPQNNTITWSPTVSDIATYAALQLQFSRVTFNLDIAYGSDDQAHIVESKTNLSMERDTTNYAVTVLNDAINGSKYVTATDLNSASTVGADVPVPTTGFSQLTNGQDGTPTANDFIGDQSAHTGFYAFDSVDVQLVTCERTDVPIATAGLAYCAARGDCMYVGAVPQGYVAAGNAAITYGQTFQAKKVYGALYGPWIMVSDPLGTGNNPLKVLPPVGHVLGVYGRIETARGIWKAPAGDEANLLGAIDVEYRLSDTEHTALVKQGSVNGIRSIPRSGIVVDASRTPSTDTRWLYVGTRLLFNYVKSSLKNGLRWVRQEPNRDTLWDAIRIQTVTPFLMGLWRQRAFGTGTPAQVFTVICDASNNPPDQVDQGNLTVEIYFYPSKPAETIIIIVGQQPSGATTSES